VLGLDAFGAAACFGGAAFLAQLFDVVLVHVWLPQAVMGHGNTTVGKRVVTESKKQCTDQARPTSNQRVMYEPTNVYIRAAKTMSTWHGSDVLMTRRRWRK
jgi:hypothetical protein